MTTYQKILAQGRAEGKAEGRAEGEAKARIQMMEKFLGLSVSPDATFVGQDAQALRNRFEELEKLYQERFKS